MTETTVPQLGTCDRYIAFHDYPHAKNEACDNWKPVAAPENPARLPPAEWNAIREHLGGRLQIAQKAEEAQGEVPQPVAELIHIKNHAEGRNETFACVNIGKDGYDPPDTVTVLSREPLYLRLTTGAHPPPDEPTIAKAERFIRKMEMCSSMAAKLILLKNFMLRGRAPHPVSSEKGTDDGVSCEISRTPDIPAGTTGRDDCRDTDRGDNSEAPVVPSKLSAQEFVAKWLMRRDDRRLIKSQPRFALPEVWELLTEYASSSDAALERMRVTAQLWKGRAEALEGQLREAQQETEVFADNCAKNLVECSRLSGEVSRLQEALRVETRKAETLLKLGSGRS